MSEYVGRHIELLDKKGVKYAGVLASISGETSTVVLHDVRVIDDGSGAAGQDGSQNALDAGVQKSLTFRGSDVQDLQVLSEHQTDQQNTAHSKRSRRARQTPSRASGSEETTYRPGEKSRNRDNIDFSIDEGKSDGEVIDADYISRHTQELAEQDKAELEEVEKSTQRAYDSNNSFFDNLSTASAGRRPTRGGGRRGRGRGGRGGSGRGGSGGGSGGGHWRGGRKPDRGNHGGSSVTLDWDV